MIDAITFGKFVTANNKTDESPKGTNSSTCSSILFTPILETPGMALIGWTSLGSSMMNNGYMRLWGAKWALLPCHNLVTGWEYPLCNLKGVVPSAILILHHSAMRTFYQWTARILEMFTNRTNLFCTSTATCHQSNSMICPYNRVRNLVQTDEGSM